MGVWLPFMAQVVVISLSGVMAPGPITAATLAAGTRSRHAGAQIALGHAIVEWPLIGLIVLGMGAIFERPDVRVAIGLAGGGLLVFMGVQMLRHLSRVMEPASKHVATHPVLIGLVLTAGNPFFLIWWATVGLALTLQARSLGWIAFMTFAFVHWLCDLVWLEALSLASHKGAQLVSPKAQRGILGVCAIALVVLGLKLAIDAL